MTLIPKVKKTTLSSEYVSLDKINWVFFANTDERVIAEAKRISVGCTDGISVYIEHNGDNAEGYTITISDENIHITAEGAAGAFYALKTLKMYMINSDNKIPVGVIEDFPDMTYRGFYHDTTRGRIPNLDTLKRLADTMADYKLNSLQLYVEHTFPFKEYEFCRDILGYISAEEMKEFDKYCHDRFIDLVPSLATFGHLYHLLQSDEHKHLCELPDYKPKRHYWAERMAHHTINPTLPESLEIIKSLIDQYCEVFTSPYFNICCDETFDLGKGVNEGKDSAILYVEFVNKLLAYVKSKGKTPMMWGDILLKHPQFIKGFPEDTVFLNWEYGKNPDEAKTIAFEDKKQIICPGTTSWWGFSERPNIEEPNIVKFSQQGYRHKAFGILNTNWGDMGNLASLDMAMYGLILGAACGWDKNTSANDEFRRAAGKSYYGNDRAVDFLSVFSDILDATNWTALFDEAATWCRNKLSEEGYQAAADKCTELRKQLENETFSTEELKEAFIIATEGYALSAKWFAAKYGYKINCSVDFDGWLKLFLRQWDRESKPFEREEHIKVFEEFNKKYKLI